MVGFEACPGAWIFHTMGAKAPGMEQPLGVTELFTAYNLLLKEGCVLQSELEYMPGPQHHPPVCHAGARRWYMREGQKYSQHLMMRERSRAVLQTKRRVGRMVQDGCHALL